MSDKEKLRKEYMRVYKEITDRRDCIQYDKATVKELSIRIENFSTELEVLEDQLEKLEKELSD